MDMIVGLCAEFVSNNGETLDFIYEGECRVYKSYFTRNSPQTGISLLYTE